MTKALLSRISLIVGSEFSFYFPNVSGESQISNRCLEILELIIEKVRLISSSWNSSRRAFGFSNLAITNINEFILFTSKSFSQLVASVKIIPKKPASF